MARTESHGPDLQCEVPDWGPLVDLAPDHVGDFMWMFEVELRGGDRLHAYKHRDTRRYLHLTSDGRAFAYRGDGLYTEVDPHRLLDEVLPEEVPARALSRPGRVPRCFPGD